MVVAELAAELVAAPLELDALAELAAVAKRWSPIAAVAMSVAIALCSTRRPGGGDASGSVHDSGAEMVGACA